MNNTVKNGINEVRLGDRLKLLDYVWEARKTFSLSQRADRVLFNWVCKTILNQISFYLLSFWFWMAVWILALFWLLTSVNSQLRFVLKMVSVTKGAKFQIANQNHNDSNQNEIWFINLSQTTVNKTLEVISNEFSKIYLPFGNLSA